MRTMVKQKAKKQLNRHNTVSIQLEEYKLLFQKIIFFPVYSNLSRFSYANNKTSHY